MTGGDVDGTCVSTSPQDRTEEARRLFLIMESSCRTGLGARLLAHTRQAALGNADGREIQPQHNDRGEGQTLARRRRCGAGCASPLPQAIVSHDAGGSGTPWCGQMQPSPG